MHHSIIEQASSFASPRVILHKLPAISICVVGHYLDVSFEGFSSVDLAPSLQSSVLLSESRNSLCQLQRSEPG